MDKTDPHYDAYQRELEQDLQVLLPYQEANKTFDPEKFVDWEKQFPGSTASTIELVEKLRAAGHEVRFAYYPCNMIIHEDDEGYYKVAHVVKSRLVEGIDDAVAKMEVHRPETIFLMGFFSYSATDPATFDEHVAYKVRYFTADLKKPRRNWGHG